MDFIADLLPRIDLLKVEHTSKDSQQSAYNKLNNTYKRINGSRSEVIKVRTKTSNWKEVDRRSGKDRRKQLEKRGRWLESRDRNNRRTVEEAISLEV